MKNLKRLRIRVNGIVQGVGFRPFIYNLACRNELAGFVSNTSRGVIVEAEGPPGTLDEFVKSITAEAPPLSQIIGVNSEELDVEGGTGFTIVPSDGNEQVGTLISPDIAVCDDCLQEMFDSGDRRYHYPFINCTNCGPRYTIIESLPYDRPFTSMRSFTQCPACQAEYDDPSNRRFHAQPNACPACGPSLSLFSIDKKPVAGDPIQETIDLLKSGAIVAIKGLGGFHLAVDAANDAAVRQLRLRKSREEKPLAVMVKNLSAAGKLCGLSEAESALLESPRAPIVLARKRDNGLPEEVAPGNDRLGVMLPYTPVHHLLLEKNFKALVMTSANISEEPICIDNEEVFRRLEKIADYVLAHDRDIYLRGDDSVFIELAGAPRPVRRSRGFAPVPILVKNGGPTVLAVGGELKNTVCLLQDEKAFVSQHIGDLENLEAFNFFKLTVDHLQKVFQAQTELIVHDMHPRYLSTQWAKEQSVPRLPVQHHHAHLASVLAENNQDGPAIGLIMDGTGYGTDGTIWGGEVLVGGFDGFERFAAFEPMLLPGGDAAIKAPWRTAVSYLHSTFDGHLPDLPFLNGLDYGPVAEMVAKNINCFPTSSCGRLFDAVAAMSGGRKTIRYEGQAAIEMMQAASEVSGKSFSYDFTPVDKMWIISVKSIIRDVVRALLSGADLSEIGRRFHATQVDIFAGIADKARTETGIANVALSGGVFQNQVLFEALIVELSKRGFSVLTHQQVPANDGGISLGQARIGRAHLKRQ